MLSAGCPGSAGPTGWTSPGDLDRSGDGVLDLADLQDGEFFLDVSLEPAEGTETRQAVIGRDVSLWGSDADCYLAEIEIGDEVETRFSLAFENAQPPAEMEGPVLQVLYVEDAGTLAADSYTNEAALASLTFVVQEAGADGISGETRGSATTALWEDGAELGGAFTLHGFGFRSARAGAPASQ